MEEQLVVLVDPWQDKYDRLMEAHEKLQKLNQCLEDKLLKLAEEHHEETTQLSNQAQELTQRLVEARLYIHQLEDENERYRNDINVVVQLLQCKPSNFISPKIDTLPEDLQRKVLGQRNGVGGPGSGRKEKKIIKVQVPTFPPTDIMYAVDKGRGKKNGDKDIVSAAIMAKVLQERENERKENRRNRCECASRIVLPTFHKETQTLPSCTISYSDFPFSSEDGILSSTSVSSTPPPPTHSQPSSNNMHHPPSTLLLQPSTNLVDIIKEEELDLPLVNTSPPSSFLRRNVSRETSFIHQSSSSSLSSPSSSSTHNLTPDLIGSSSSSSNNGRKMAGHCVRVASDDHKELLDNNDSSGGCHNHGVITHWRTTVLVQHPPKSLETIPLLQNHHHHQQQQQSHTNLQTASDSHQHNQHQHNNLHGAYGPADLLDSDDAPLNYPAALCSAINGSSSSSVSNNSNNHSHHNSNGSHSAANPYPAHQYYRAQKRTFWTRSSSTTSTETEI